MMANLKVNFAKQRGVGCAFGLPICGRPHQTRVDTLDNQPTKNTPRIPKKYTIMQKRETNFRLSFVILMFLVGFVVVQLY